ncbi:MAG: molecular chaperone TorD family protein [Acidobacteriota bacterium]|jgi:nitrate reductase assembly molybdenum cofactor insertion protein NarJ
MNPGRPNEPEIRCREAISEAAHWRLAGLLLERPRAGWWREIESVSEELDHPGLLAAAGAGRDAGEGPYLHLFGPGGLISPREVTYRTKEDPGGILADVAGIYEAFAFSPRTEDPKDHISVEVNFAGFLCLKEAYALAEGNPDAVQTISRGLHTFLRDHLGPFALALEQRFEDSSPGYLAETIRCLTGLIQKRIAPSVQSNGS